jgi:ElaB/YqjD/DUF883 family membrane-anchored ribosome-binding protein
MPKGIAVRDDVARLTDQITSVLQEFTNLAGRKAGRNYRDARSSFDSVLSDVSGRGREMAGSAYEAANAIEESVEDLVAERPIATIGIALAIGFVIGFSCRR